MPTIAELQKECHLLRRKLAVAETRFHNVIENNADGIVIVDRHGVLRFQNPAAAQMFDCPAQELTGKMFGYPVIANETAEIDLLRQDNTTRIAEMRVAEIEWEGEPMYLASLRDITERKRTEEKIHTLNAQLERQLAERITQLTQKMVEHSHTEQALSDSENRFQAAQDISLEAFTILRSVRDAQGKIVDFEWTYANLAAGSILKHPPETLVGQRLLDMLPGNRENRALFERYVRITETGKSDEVEFEYCADGITGWFRNMVVKLGDGVAVAFSDITERKHAEMFLRQSKDALEHLVAERTMTLETVNRQLQQELAERKRVEAQLRISLEKYRVLFEAFPIGISVTDQEGKLLEANRESERLLGISIQEQLHRKFDSQEWQIIRPDGSPMPSDEYASVRALKEQRLIENVEMGIVKASQEITWINVHAVPIPLEGYGILISYHDITKRKRAEEALRESEERFRALFQQANNSIVIIDPQTGKITDCNRVAHEHLGYTAAECLQLYVTDVDMVSNDEAAAWLHKIVEQGSMVFETQQRTKTGEIRNMLIHASRIISQNRCFVLGIGHDITERTQIEKTLMFLAEHGWEAANETFFQALARFLAETLRMDYVCIDQLQGDLLAAQTVAVYFDGKFEDNVCYTLKDTPCGNVVSNGICRFPCGVRHLFPNDVVLQEMAAESYLGTTLSDSKGTSIGLIAIIGRRPLEQTQTAETILKIAAVRTAGELERKRAEEELRRAKDAAESGNRAKSQFLSSMSHELRTPLNAILGYTQLFLKDASLTEKQQEAIQIMHSSGEHLLMLIGDVLDFAKIDAGKLELNPADFHLPNCLHTLVKMVRLSASQKDVPLFIAFAANLPHMIYGDEKRLRQILLNLLNNAIKFTAHGCVSFKVSELNEFAEFHIAQPRRTHRLRFEVEDTGVGIAAADLEHIFLPFHQVGDKRYYSSGVGLGLPISQRFLKLMGSELHVASTLGQGSRFWFDLDVVKSSWKQAEGEYIAPSASESERDTAPAQPADSIIPPPRSALALVEQYAKIGDIFAVREQIEAIAALDDAYAPFVAVLRPLAKNLNLSKIRAFLTQFMEDTE